MIAGRYRYVAIEGPIGAGKTSLARKLAQHFQAHTLLEKPEANPFLERFYSDRQRYALPTQLFFLFQRVQQLAEVRQLDLFRAGAVRRLPARQGPSVRAPDAGRRRAAAVRADPGAAAAADAGARPRDLPAGKPRDHWSSASHGAAIRSKSRIGEDYLRRWPTSYTRFFHQYDDAPVLIVNTEHLNPIDSDDDFQLLLDRIGKLRGRREYFNLAA